LKVFSLDVSPKCTGWCFYNGKTFKFGTIETNKKEELSVRLAEFRKKLKKLLDKLKPCHIVIEEPFFSRNIRVCMLLSYYVGVAQETSYEVLNIKPFIISNKKVKSYFKAKTKEDLFAVWDNDNWSFKKDNDISDAMGQLMCYCDDILGFKKFKTETDYGVRYEC